MPALCTVLAEPGIRGSPSGHQQGLVTWVNAVGVFLQQDLRRAAEALEALHAVGDASAAQIGDVVPSTGDGALFTVE